MKDEESDVGREHGDSDARAEPALVGALFEPVEVGELRLDNRIVMAPMTRRRAGDGGVPTELNALYYGQRASAGLIVSEAAVIHPAGAGVPGSPGIHTEEQVGGWRRVVDAVHDRGGRIVLQLWHAGRVSHPEWLDGRRPVAPSAVAVRGELPGAPGGPYPRPRALRPEEVDDVVQAFADGARRARRAGFDGVEIHAAQGYLVDQFLRSSANRRTDVYGGVASSRVRFLLDVIRAVSGAWSAGRVGVQVSPTSPLNDMSDPDPRGLFSLVAERLASTGIAYLHVHEPVDRDSDGARIARQMRRRFPGPMILNGGHDGRTAARAVETGEADMVSFGRPFIANPDLPARIERGVPFAPPDPATFYGGGARGYTDYPTAEGQGSGGSPYGGTRADAD